jgi:two-component system response regulator FlrC
MNLKSDISLPEINFVAQAPSSINIFSLARRVAKYNVPVLITGETGTGKECIAKYIHHYSFNGNGPYVGLNCAAIPESMLEAMLFGYEKGAFTGAVTSVPGKFEQANGGTLLLDEIGDMPLSLQAKLLRVLQEQEVERLGSHKKIPLNIRLIASTNKDLEAEINEGRFRQDLFYRLSVVPIHIPPLRDRIEDILPLVQRFIKRYGMFSGHNPRLSREAEILLQSHSWPGNVRELENVIQRGMIMSNGEVINIADLGLKNDEMPIVIDDVTADTVALTETNNHLKQKGRVAEYQYIIDLLRRHQGNKSKTAQFLGITPRALRYRLASMRQQGIDIECFSS